MSEQQHTRLPVARYRAQTASAIELVNANKLVEERGLRVLDALAAREDVDKRWLAIASTDLERGWLAANRAVFKLSRVALTEDADSAAN